MTLVHHFSIVVFSILAASPLALAGERQEIISFTNVWKYDDSGLNLGTSWREPNYSDSSWASGAGALGFPANENLLGLASIPTPLKRFISGSSGPQPTNYYFRTTFEWTRSPQGVTLFATNLIDDGAVFYLNGAEIARAGMLAGPVASTTLALRSGEISGYGPDVFHVDNAPLVTGQNILAVELHQGTENSSDAIFAMNLWAELPPDGPVQIVQQPSSQTRLLGTPASFAVGCVGTPPYSFQWTKNNGPIPGATNQTYTINMTRFSDAGIYRVRAWNAFGEDLSNEARLDVVRSPSVLIPFNQTWRYEASGSNQGTAWRETNFDDSGWASGPGPLGNEQVPLPEPLRTVFPLLSDAATYYFRTTFELLDEPVDLILRSTNLIDDGFIYYLNGVEVARLGMPNGVVTFQSVATRTIGDAVFETLILPASNLVVGHNILAAEVHQSTTTSSDMVFGMKLVADFIPPNTLSITNEPIDAAIKAPQGVTFSVGVSGIGARYQWYHDSQLVSGATKATFTIPSVSAADAGNYQVRVSNEVNVVYSRMATLTVLEDREPPQLILADGGSTFTNVFVRFSEEITAASATNQANYQLRDASGTIIQIIAVERINDREVRLRTAPRQFGINYLLAVTNVTDTAPASNSGSSAIPLTVTVPVVALESSWTFYDPVPGFDALHPGVGWNTNDFDDLLWGLGQAGFAYGQNSQALPVPANTALASGPITSFFRNRWVSPYAPMSAQLFLRHAVDDGAAFYLNGTEIYRFNLPNGALSVTTPSLQPIAAVELTPLILLTNVSVQATNVLAAELHRNSTTDQHAFFAAELTARILSWPSGPIQFARDLSDTLVDENSSFQLDFVAVGNQTVQWYRNGQPIPTATEPILRVDRATSEWNANIQVVLANDTHGATSRVMRLTVVPDSIPPQLIEAVSDGSAVLLTFSEALDPVSANALDSYRILSASGQSRAILSVSVLSGNTVRLVLDTFAQVGDVVRLRHLRDQSAQGNEIASGSGRTIGFHGALIPIDATWRYDDFSFGRATLSWTEFSFNDTIWPAGQALLGRENAALPEPIRTQILAPSVGGPLVVYLRHRFTYPSSTPAAVLFWETLVDDGLVLYLNGLEIARLGVPAQGPVTDANRVVGNAEYEGPFSVSATNLLAGENILAVALYQESGGSADVAFGLRLSMNDVPSLPIPAGPILNIQRDGAQLTIWWGGTGWSLEDSPEPRGPWSPVPAQANPFSVTVEGDRRFYRLSENPF